MLRPSYSLRSLLIAVAALAVFLAVTKAFLDLVPLLNYNNGPHEFMLRSGQKVVTFHRGEENIPVAFENDRKTTLPTGTPCVVITDFAGDRDDCTAYREIKVKVDGGVMAGKIVYVAREHLRVR